MKLVATLLGVMLAIPVAGATPQIIKYDHYAVNENLTTSVRVDEGQFFEVEISNTCDRSSVLIDSYGVKAPVVAAPAVAPIDCTVSGGLRKIQIAHLPQYGGYIVRIRPATTSLRHFKTNSGSNCGAAPVPADCKELKEVMLFIHVEERGFDYDISGAFTVSDLTDPVFSLAEETSGAETAMRVERNREAEDSNRLGFAGMINLFHHRRPLFAGTFGLGINENSDVSFFAGPSIRLGGKAFLTAGWNWGPIDRLPAGTSVGDIVSDTNLLSDLPSRTDSAFFVAISYSFLSPGEGFFKKPFATSEDS